MKEIRLGQGAPTWVLKLWSLTRVSHNHLYPGRARQGVVAPEIVARAEADWDRPVSVF